MPSPYLAPSLARARTAINTRWPGRDHTSDGWIGDRAHQARVSDHNPDSSGVVRALDIDRDGVHIPTVLVASMIHPSVRYVIHNRRVFHANNQFRPQTYTGSNPHTGHIHISIQHLRSAEVSKTSWLFIESVPTWREIGLGDTGTGVRHLQAFLNAHGASLTVDGQFGDGTLGALLSFQRVKKIEVDGVAGAETYLTLRTR